MNIEAYFKKQSQKINKALLTALPRGSEHPAQLSQAMRYAVLSGGKRIRPILTLASCEAVQGHEAEVLSAAIALELIHSYSLVHDDLPCMDNDLLRRGKPSCHAKFGEVTALLAGDALLTQAFRVLSRSTGVKRHAFEKRMLHAIGWISEAIGHQGMVGGQALDMQYQGKESEIDLPTMEYINTHKSGALIAVGTRVGAYLGGGSPAEVEALYTYGKTVGLLFQVVDDILDKQGYTQVASVKDARDEAQRLLAKAKKALAPLEARGHVLYAIAEYIATRTS